jgi:hypothetical protein
MENASDNLVKFLREESWRMSGTFNFIASSLVLTQMIIDYAALVTKYLADELDWNALRVFPAQNPTCVEAPLAKRCYRRQSLTLLHAIDDLGVGRDNHILPECRGQVSLCNK